jgi:PAS domain S-box-containing protein
METLSKANITNSIFNNMPVAVYTCNSHGYIDYYNTAAEKVWGKKPILGQDKWTGADKIYHLDGTPMPIEQSSMARMFKQGLHIKGENAIIERPDGTRIIVKPHPELITDNDGNVLGAINTLLDIRRCWPR